MMPQGTEFAICASLSVCVGRRAAEGPRVGARHSRATPQAFTASNIKQRIFEASVRACGAPHPCPPRKRGGSKVVPAMAMENYP